MKIALFNEYLDGDGTSEDNIYLNPKHINSFFQHGSEAVKINMINGDSFVVFGDARKLANRMAATKNDKLQAAQQLCHIYFELLSEFMSDEEIENKVSELTKT